MIVCARNVSAAAASAQTLLHLFEIFATSCTFSCICCLVSSKHINVFCVDIDVCCCHCRWFVSSQVPFLSQDWETWKTMQHIDPSQKPEVAEVSCENTCTSVRMRRSQQKSGVTFSDVYLVPSPIVQICRNNSD